METRQEALIDLGEDSTPVDVARVLVDVDLPQLDHPLDYLVPPELAPQARPGRSVRVRLAGRRTTGWIVAREVVDPGARTLQPLLAVISDTAVVSPAILHLARSLADRTVSTASQVLSLALPPRHARTERAVLAEPHPEENRVDTPPPPARADHRGGGAQLEHLAAGEHPRAVWTALPTSRDAQLCALVRATRSSGRSVVVVVPTTAQVGEVRALLAADLGEEHVEALTSEDSAAHRYRVHLEALLGRVRVVVGTRSAVWAPVEDLGLVVVWDDGDDRLVEQRSPHLGALDVAVARARSEGAGLVAGAYARSTKAQALVQAHWAASLVPERDALRAATARVWVPDDFDRDREGAAAGSHLPPSAQRLIRRQLAVGPVLVQVPLAGYVPVVSCQRCRRVARCTHCGGALSLHRDGSITCAWCGRDPQSWRCPECAGTRLRSLRVGSERTGEELGRAFPGVALTISSAQRGTTREVGEEPRLVVATPGAEPHARGGYAAVLILDAPAIASRPELWAPEEALRRWFNALVLARPGVPAVVLGGVERTLAQTLVRWDPADFAARSLDERAALGFFPAMTVVALDGAPEQVAEVVDEARAQVMGTVPRQVTAAPEAEGSAGPTRPAATVRPGAGRGSTEAPMGTDAGAPGRPGPAQEVRTLIRVPREDSEELFARLRTIQQRRSSRRLPLVRVSVNPPELF
ncbi:MAG: primosome assembly protein PriA [Propionibacterium sp.]|nr:primosome assembly protein PriA [Propionibacterium sp.]